MLTVQEALESILRAIRQLPAAQMPLMDSLGRVLAEDVLADIDSPPFDNSAVDGYAVRAADTESASQAKPVVLREVADVPAGIVAAETITAGTCARVMTGAPIPEGADAMVMIEDSRRREGFAEILASSRPGDHIRRKAEDVTRGQTVLRAGALIRSAEVAMLAAMGGAQVSCIRQPRVAVISTGDELVDIGERPSGGRIRDSNRYALAGLVEEAGAELHSIRHVPDDEAATESAFRACIEGPEPADVIVTSGGVSVGDRDFVKPVLERMGSLQMWRVKMKPGKPLAYGRIGDSIFFGLPGNPVSTMVTFEIFVRPALWRMAGRSDLSRPRVQVRLTADVAHAQGREEYVRAMVTTRNGELYADPTGAQGSGILTSMLGANALIVIPTESTGLKADEEATALLIHPPYG